MDKEDVVYIYIYVCVCVCVCVCVYDGILAIKKNEIMPYATTWMHLETIILSEVKTEKDKYYITYMWNLINNTNEAIYKTETDSQT